MTAGKTHDQITWALSGFLIGGYALAGYYAFAAAGGALVGLWLSPDLDCVHSQAKRRWRSLGLGWLWYPYRQIVPRHRHPLSHLPILGTAGRLVYLGWPLLVWGDPAWLIWWTWAVAATVGLAVADLGHWVADGCPL
ncbi:MAG: DUF2227 family putative metal-binding protein [Cyanobacteria bacterium J06642_11]